MKKVLVTGATGFIGKWVVRELINNGVEVIAVVRENTKNLNTLSGLSVRVIECNLNKLSGLPYLISDRDIDTVYHLAWQGVSDADIKDATIQIQNLQATLDLIGAMQLMGIKTIIGAGSLHEAESIIEMSENKVILNLGYMYKASKIAAHWMGKAKAGAAGIRFFWPVISNAYGEGEISGRLINMVIRNIFAGKPPDLSDGEQNYDFVHISDVVHALYLIGEKGVDGTNYIIGSGHAKPLKEYLLEVGEIANKTKGGDVVSLGFGRIKSNVVFLPIEAFDIMNLVRDTGYCPRISFKEGITRTICWIKSTYNDE